MADNDNDQEKQGGGSVAPTLAGVVGAGVGAYGAANFLGRSKTDVLENAKASNLDALLKHAGEFSTNFYEGLETLEPAKVGKVFEAIVEAQLKAVKT